MLIRSVTELHLDIQTSHVFAKSFIEFYKYNSLTTFSNTVCMYSMEAYIP